MIEGTRTVRCLRDALTWTFSTGFNIATGYLNLYSLHRTLYKARDGALGDNRVMIALTAGSTDQRATGLWRPEMVSKYGYTRLLDRPWIVDRDALWCQLPILTIDDYSKFTRRSSNDRLEVGVIVRMSSIGLNVTFFLTA